MLFISFTPYTYTPVAKYLELNIVGTRRNTQPSYPNVCLNIYDRLRFELVLLHPAQTESLSAPADTMTVDA